MSDLPGRTLLEMVAKYSLHPEFRAVWTEGSSDRQFVSWFFRQVGCDNIEVQEIGDIEPASFAYHEFSSRGLRAGNNRDSVIVLALLFAKEGIGPGVVGIADRDRPDLATNCPNCPNLILTDHRDLEMYAYNQRALDKFLSVSCGLDGGSLVGTRIAENILTWLTPLLRRISAIHDAADVFPWGMKKTALRRYLDYDTETRRLIFRDDPYISALLMANGRLTQRSEFEAEVSRRQAWPGCATLHIRGHTFVEILAAFLTGRLSKRNEQNVPGLCRGLLASIEVPWFLEEPLFKSLCARMEQK